MPDHVINIKIIVAIALVLSSVGGIITTSRQQTSRRCIPHQVRWRLQSTRAKVSKLTRCPARLWSGFVAVELSGSAMKCRDCIARWEMGSVHYQGMGSILGRREVLRNLLLPGSNRRLWQSGGVHLLMASPSSPKHSKTSQHQGDSAKNGDSGTEGNAFLVPPFLNINTWHLPGVPNPSKMESNTKVPKEPSPSSTGTFSTNTTTNATIAELNGTQGENPRSHTTASSRTQTPLPVDNGGVRKKATKGTTQVSTEIRARRKKKKLKLPPRGEVRRPLVVRDNMDLADVTSLVQEVLERVSETERELRRLRREGSLPETRSSVRERKFVIDTRAKMLGAAFAGCLSGMLVGWSVLPNLWLVGGVAGAISCATLSRTTGTIGSLCATFGIQVALFYKDLRDWWEQTTFLYKTGKLSYTYWKNFEEYDQAWGMTEKYNSLVRKISKEASELDRQYKIRANAIRAGVRLTKFSKKMGWSAAREAKQIASVATDWGGNQLTRWGLVGDQRSGEMDGESPKNRILLWRWPGVGDDAASFLKRPLGISFDVEGIFGGERHSLYSAPPAGGTRKPGYRGEPVIPARIRHLFMTPKQVRDERLRKYRVGFMGMRISRRWDKDD